MKTVRIFSDRIRDRICLEGFKSVRIRVRIFNIRYRIRIRIFKSYIYDVDIQSYLIRHSWHYPYSNPNSTRNTNTNMISMISVRIRSVFIPTLLLCSQEHSREEKLSSSPLSLPCFEPQSSERASSRDRFESSKKIPSLSSPFPWLVLFGERS